MGEEQSKLNISNYFIGWTPEQPIKILPENIRNYFKEDANLLYDDLKQNKLYRIMIPAPDPHFEGHMIRITVFQNPPWYSELYRLYHFPNKRKRDRAYNSNIRRDRSLRALDRIINEKDKKFIEGKFGNVPCLGRVDTIYREFIHERLIDGYSDRGVYVSPIKEVRIFFGLEPIIQNDIPF